MLQTQEMERKEPVQGKFESVQRQTPEDEELLQGKFATRETSAQLQGDGGEAENRTGMPGRLKAGLEQLSGMDLSGVRVHNNSSKPEQVNALAYTQGQDIHVGPGQEKHLPHEGWHAVQQMQGRVKPTMQAKGMSINDDAALEREADVTGAKAPQMKREEQATTGIPGEAIGTSEREGRLNFLSTGGTARTLMRTFEGSLDQGGKPDQNNVAAGADAAVKSAESSSGSPLPGSIRSRFESSLGADLSSVRVHTGPKSADAAGAVGARAYTVGQDIHFGEGHYDRSSDGWTHVIAHEVAHTVQQQGGSPHRQNKLEVSTPGDSAEVEVDRAADAMVKGAPATLTPAGGMARAIIQRDPEKKDIKHPGSAGETPFDVADLPPGTLEEIEALGVAELSSLANDMVNHAYTDFLAACRTVKGRLSAKKKAREEKEKKWVEMAIGAAGLLLGGVGGAIGARVAAAPFQKMVTNRVLDKMPALLRRIAPRMAEDARGS